MKKKEIGLRILIATLVVGVFAYIFINPYFPENQIDTIKKEAIFNKFNYDFCNYQNSTPLSLRLPPPDGFKRIETENDFGNWLRNLPLKQIDEKIETFDGKKLDQSKYHFFNTHLGVVDLPIIHEWEQCADVLLRLKSEFHFGRNEFKNIEFNFANGKRKYSKNNSHFDLEKFLIKTYGVMGTASMKQDFEEVPGQNSLQIGDLLVQNQSGGVGHVFIILDIAENEDGKRMYLLGQGNTPAQSFHVFKFPYTLNPWQNLDVFLIRLKQSWRGKAVFRRF